MKTGSRHIYEDIDTRYYGNGGCSRIRGNSLKCQETNTTWWNVFHRIMLGLSMRMCPSEVKRISRDSWKLWHNSRTSLKCSIFFLEELRTLKIQDVCLDCCIIISFLNAFCLRCNQLSGCWRFLRKKNTENELAERICDCFLGIGNANTSQQ